MRILIRAWICVAALTTGLAATALAGLNAGGTARIYWLPRTLSRTPVVTRDTTGDVVIGLVVAKGITDFRGADVQLVINSFDESSLPMAWQAQTGGPAEGGWTAKAGGWQSGTSHVWPNVFTASPALSAVSVGMDGSILYSIGRYPFCTAPHGVGVVWFSAAASASVARTSTTYYSVFGFAMDFSVVPGLAGGPDDPAGPKAVCINPNWRLPCPQPSVHGNVMATMDGTLAIDYLPFENGYQYLTYSGSNPLSPGPGCPLSTPTRTTTWGKLRQLYR